MWWQLPGPGAFVERVVADLRDGTNVVLCLPQHVPAGLSDAIRARLNGQDGLAWRTLDARAIANPVQALYERFVPERLAGTVYSPARLAMEQSFTGWVICLDDIPELAWPNWKLFLAEYAHACRGRNVFERAVFCVALTGGLSQDPPPDDVCLVRRVYGEGVDALDALLFASNLARRRPVPEVQRRMLASVLANLALWDPRVAVALADEPMRCILEPLPALIAMANERRWSAADYAAPRWCDGQVGRFDGETRLHSALLAARCADSAIASDAGGMGQARRELERRIWRAQVGVWLPFVEERRQECIAQLRHALRLPFTTVYGEVIVDPHDLEIGFIEAAMHPKMKLRHTEALARVRHLRDIRNALSHLEPLSIENLRALGPQGWISEDA